MQTGFVWDVLSVIDTRSSPNVCSVPMRAQRACGRRVIRNDRCIFHLEAKTPEEVERFKEEFVSHVLTGLNDSQLQQIDCTGFMFPKVVIELSSHRMRRTFQKCIDFSDTVVESELIFAWSTVDGETKVSFSRAVFKAESKVNFANARICGKAVIDFSKARFSREATADFAGATFCDSATVDFHGCELDEDATAWFYKAKFTGTATAYFQNARFRGKSGVFFWAEFNDKACIEFIDARLWETASIRFDNAVFNDASSVHMIGTEFNDETLVSFNGAQFSDGALVNSLLAAFNDKSTADFSDAKLGASCFRHLQIEDTARVRFGAIESNQPQDLSKVFLVHADVRYMFFGNVKWGSSPPGCVADERTITRPGTAVDELMTEQTYVPSYQDVVTLYRGLRYNYERQLRYGEAAGFFVREMELLRTQPCYVGIAPRLTRAPGSAWKRIVWNFGAASRRLRGWLSIAAVYYVLAKYGESYRRVTAWCLLSVLIIYPLVFPLFKYAYAVLLSLAYRPAFSLGGLVSLYPERVARGFRLFFQVFEPLETLTLLDVIFRLWAGLLLALLYISLRRKFDRRR